MDWRTQIVLPLLGNLVANATPAVVDAARTAAWVAYQEALKTPNPWDDILAGMLLATVGMPTAQIEPPSPPDKT